MSRQPQNAELAIDAMPDEDWLPGDPWRDPPSPILGDYYPTLTQFLRNRPDIRSVVEIGVRTGYSMAALLRGNPHIDYLGLDVDGGAWGGVRGGMLHAGMLAHRYSKGMVVLRQQSSQSLQRLPRDFDLAYIDGNHDEACVRHDLALCAASCQWILCDDYIGVQACPGVTAAVDAFIRDHGVPAEVWNGRWVLLDVRKVGGE